MSSNGPFLVPPRTDISPRHGFTESHSENMLRDSILITAALTGSQVALVLRDVFGTWYRDSTGLSSDQLARLEVALNKEGTWESGNPLLEEEKLGVLQVLPLVDDCQQSLGFLCLLSPDSLDLSPAQTEGLRLLVEHIQTIVIMDQHKIESRTTPRPPSAASFVPGLVHELGSFIFGISANLDAFEARFAGMDEVGKYGSNIRRSLDRMGEFIVELREYGYPQRLSWTRLDVATLMREAVEHNQPQAKNCRIELELCVEGDLPMINGDRDGLRTAFTRVIDLVLKQEAEGGRVVLVVAKGQHGNRVVICGHLDCSSMKFTNVDPARLFEPFYSRVSGLGRLALPGARRILEAHGGTLTAGPGPIGCTRFSFMLPS